MIVGFHSYKGGVGRTKVMVGVGALMTMRGYRVGMLDFDLDASSLATMFGLDTNARHKSEKDLLHILISRDLSAVPKASIDLNDLLAERFGSMPRTPGRLVYWPTLSDPKKSDRLILSDLPIFIEDLLNTVHSNCGVDLILVDMKPGWSPAFRELVEHVHRLVLVSRIDEQNIDGLSRLVKIADRQEPLMVLNMVPDSPKSMERIAMFESACGIEATARIPLDPELFFDDDIVLAADINSSFRQGLERVLDALLSED